MARVGAVWRSQCKNEAESWLTAVEATPALA